MKRFGAFFALFWGND